MGPDFERAKTYVFDRLATELSPRLKYHCLEHTSLDVLPAAIRLGKKSGLSKEDLLILATAALYHDTGFLKTYAQHEHESIAIARETLPGFGYADEQIARITAIIAATQMPQRPKDSMQQLICDADLDLLGREDFWSLNRKLLNEVRYFSEEPVTEEQWLRGQTRFLAEHSYFTPAAHGLRDDGKVRNLARLRQALASLNGRSGHPAPIAAES